MAQILGVLNIHCISSLEATEFHSTILKLLQKFATKEAGLTSLIWAYCRWGVELSTVHAGPAICQLQNGSLRMQQEQPPQPGADGHSDSGNTTSFLKHGLDTVSENRSPRLNCKPYLEWNNISKDWDAWFFNHTFVFKRQWGVQVVQTQKG